MWHIKNVEVIRKDGIKYENLQFIAEVLKTQITAIKMLEEEIVELKNETKRIK